MRRWRIDTAERIAFQYEAAGMATRLSAWLYDQAILMALRVAAVFVLLSSGARGAPLFFLAMFALDFGYFLVWEQYGDGRSLGKRRFGLRVVASDGGRLAFSALTLRNLLRPVDMLPLGLLAGATIPATALGGALSSFFDRAARRLGDLAAGTLVVVDRPLRLDAPPTALKSRENTFQRDAALRHRILARATRGERDVIFDLALRRDALDPASRDALFARAAAYFRRRYGLPDALAFLSDEQTVLNLALVLARREEG